MEKHEGTNFRAANPLESAGPEEPRGVRKENRGRDSDRVVSDEPSDSSKGENMSGSGPSNWTESTAVFHAVCQLTHFSMKGARADLAGG